MPAEKNGGIAQATGLMSDSRDIPFLVSAQPDLHGNSSWKLVEAGSSISVRSAGQLLYFAQVGFA